MNLDFFAKPVVLAAAVIAFVAASLYAVIDTPIGVIETPIEVPDSGNKAASVTSLVGGLEAKLAKDPDDAKSWLLLAKSHDHLGNRDAAWAAYARAKEMGVSDVTLEIKLAANISELMSNN